MTGGVTPFWDWARRHAHITNEYVSSGLAEFLGTFILCLFAVGGGCQSTLFFMASNSTDIINFGHFEATLAGCLGLMIAVTLFGGVSGGHLNPAVTFALAISGKVSWYKVLVYWFAQFFGAYLGAGMAYALYYDLFETACAPALDVPRCIPSSIFAPSPMPRIGIPFLDQVVGTSILVMIIMSAIDKRNMKVPTFFYGFLFALTILAVNLAFGINAGGVLNPARDIGPRLMAITVGYDASAVFRTKSGNDDVEYWVGPFFGCFVGAALAAIVYVLVIGAQVNDDDDESPRTTQRVPMPPGPVPSQYGYPQGPRPNWRDTEIRKLPPVSLGPGSPPPHQPHNNNYY